MKISFTSINKEQGALKGISALFRSMGLMLLTVLGLFSSSSLSAQTYCTADHYVVGCPTYDMYIGEISIDQGATNIFYKADDKCNQTSPPNYTLMSSTASFTLVAGGSYSITLSTGSQYGVWPGVWIDLNGDGDFSDAGEMIHNSSWQIIPRGSKRTYNFTIACNNIKAGSTRMRIRTEYEGYTSLTQAQACGQLYYGECEDYTIDLALPAAVAADFFLPDTAFVGTPIALKSLTKGAFLTQWDVLDDGTVDYTGENATHIFSTTGRYRVTLKTQNCLGRDSITKIVNIVNPSAPPVVDFVANKNSDLYIGIDDMQLMDLSTNGPTYWEWYMYRRVLTLP